MDLRILLVDDSEVTRRMIRTVLETRNWTICGEAEDGFAGVSQYRALQPDVVILDLAMPGMSGLDTARCMYNLDRSVPLILFTLVDELYLKNIAHTVEISAMVSKDHVLGLLEAIESVTAAKLKPSLSPGRHTSLSSNVAFPAASPEKFN